MNAILRFLFPSKPDGVVMSWFLLSLRLVFGILLMTHGYQKLSNFETMSTTFPDPLGVGSSISLGLAIFAELICSLGFVLGAFYRLALIPMIFTMMVAFFVIHGGDSFAVKELAFVYLVVFLLMYVVGPGKYAFDRMIAVNMHKKEK